MSNQKIIAGMRRCAEKSEFRDKLKQATAESAASKEANEKYAGSISAVVERVNDLRTLVVVSRELLQRQTKTMTTEKHRRKGEAVLDNYERLFRVVKEMEHPETYITHTLDVADAKGDLTKLPNSRGATQIKSFIALMEECAVGREAGVQPVYEAIIDLGKKTLELAQKVHKGIILDNAAFVEREKSVTREEMDRDSGMSM
ncbi:hypothetical protein FACS1894139_07880 [Planctomycetales bacterium]|nr:hypothetical protein FACS1894107_09380 [Planctomycetales bacterium]GHT04923.1 hypothetical protein FACS1894139_07880 [Planctomycetales bacterium]